MPTFGLIGYPLGHSFSKKYFTQKFENEGLDQFRYELFPLANIANFPKIISENPDLRGLNVTIPHKENVIPFLDKLAETAREAEAVNCIKIENDGRLVGHNTDVYGFEISLLNFLKEKAGENWRENLNKNIAENLPGATFTALILGTGGAAKAVAAALRRLKIRYLFVSRKPENAPEIIDYQLLPHLDFDEFLLVINTTPLGMAPKIDAAPDLPFEKLTARHLVFDLLYNPAETLFLKKAAACGAATKNGLEMLELQAEKSWEIWNLKK